MEAQSARYAAGLPDNLPAYRRPLPFLEEPFAAHYARAKELSADAGFDEIKDLAEDCHRAIRGRPKEATAIVQAYRLQIDAIKWRLAKMLPKKYGDKLNDDQRQGARYHDHPPVRPGFRFVTVPPC